MNYFREKQTGTIFQFVLQGQHFFTRWERIDQSVLGPLKKIELHIGKKS